MRERLGRENLDGPQFFFQKIVSPIALRNLITNEAFALCSALPFPLRSGIAESRKSRAFPFIPYRAYIIMP